jgi:hypothetical protein
MIKKCKKHKCNKKYYAKGRCRSHYLQLPEVKKRQKVYAANYYMKNFEKITATSAKYVEDNKEKVKKTMAAWYQKNKKRINKKAKARYHRLKNEGTAV